MNWNQYSKRRGKMSLHDFLSDCNSKQAAFKLFKTMGVEPPSDNELEAFYAPPAPEPVPEPEQSPEPESESEPPVTTTPEQPAHEQPVVTSFTKKSKVSNGTRSTG
jgi:outer membrane biosynthesis protein TonB